MRINIVQKLVSERPKRERKRDFVDMYIHLCGGGSVRTWVHALDVRARGLGW
jgi:hypothetical protein